MGEAVKTGGLCRGSYSDPDFDVLSRLDPAGDGPDIVGALLNARPRGGEQHHDGNCSPGQILLMTEILIRCHQQLVAIHLRMVQ